MSQPSQARLLAYLMLPGDELGAARQRFAQDSLFAQGAGAAYFFSDSLPQADVALFLRLVVPRLLRQLNRTTASRRVEYAGQVRGRVDWPATYKARYQDEYNPALYVCRQPQRRTDLPENQLLKFLLLAIAQATELVPASLRQAERWAPGVAGMAGDLATRLATFDHQTRLLLNHARLREVQVPARITARHLLRARTAKTELYGWVAGLYERYEQLVRQRRWQSLREACRRTLLLPDGEAADEYLRLLAAAWKLD